MADTPMHLPGIWTTLMLLFWAACLIVSFIGAWRYDRLGSRYPRNPRDRR